MMNEQIIVEKLIEKFRFQEPVSPDVKIYISVSKQNNLKNILKNEKKFGLITGAALFVYFLARKAGFTLSFFQAAVISGAVTMITTVTIIAGGVSGVKYVIEKNNVIEVVPPPAIEVPDEKAAIPAVKSVSIYTFSGTHDSSKIAERATGIIYKKLLAERGEGNVMLSSFSAKSGYLVTGSVEKLQTGYLMTVKVVDPSRGVILNMETIEIDSEEDLHTACSSIAKKISKTTR